MLHVTVKLWIKSQLVLDNLEISAKTVLSVNCRTVLVIDSFYGYSKYYYIQQQQQKKNLSVFPI